jgi:5-(carboxyamino)imidazole ribonucleotide mutase
LGRKKLFNATNIKLNRNKEKRMTPVVSIIMGSTSDLPVMEKAALLLDEMEVPFEINALSAHRTPAEVEEFARGAASRGIRVIIAAAGMAAALPGVIAANTTLPVIGVPIKGMLDGLDALLSIVQMPPGIPVATVGVNGAQNAAILAVQMLALSDETVAARLAAHKEGLKQKIVKANSDLAEVKFKFKTNQSPSKKSLTFFKKSLTFFKKGLGFFKKGLGFF